MKLGQIMHFKLQSLHSAWAPVLLTAVHGQQEGALGPHPPAAPSSVWSSLEAYSSGRKASPRPAGCFLGSPGGRGQIYSLNPPRPVLPISSLSSWLILSIAAQIPGTTVRNCLEFQLGQVLPSLSHDRISCFLH